MHYGGAREGEGGVGRMAKKTALLTNLYRAGPRACGAIDVDRSSAEWHHREKSITIELLQRETGVTGDRSNQDPRCFVKILKYMGFCSHEGS